MEEEEIDKERGVVLEEWRIGQGAERRMLDKYLPVLFKDSRYAQRLPIGKKEIIENFNYETLKNFYSTWYRPDLMAVVVVGDYDVDKMEEKIKTHFGNIKSNVSRIKKRLYEVPDHSETLVSIERDIEASVNRINIYYKSQGMAKNSGSLKEYRNEIVEELFTGMLNRRLDELKQQESPPFIYGRVYYGGTWAMTKDAYQCNAVVGGDGIQRGLETLLEENQRVKQHGFTQSEFDRYKLELLSRLEEQYNERDKTESRSYASKYVRLFLEADPAPGIEFEYQFYKDNIDKITLADLNTLAEEFIRTDNRVVVITASLKDDVIMPQKKEVEEMVRMWDSKKVEPYVDNLVAGSLMEELPEPGQITDSKELEKINSTLLSFSNGINIYLKPSDFKNDEILFSAYSQGGHSLYEDADYHSALHTDAIMDESGIARFSKTDLTKLMAGKNVSMTAYIGAETEGLKGSCVPKDLETMLQLAHLSFTAPRNDEQAFKAYISKNKSLYKNLRESPQYYYYDQLNKIMTKDHLRGGGLPADEDFDKISYKRAGEIYRERFGDPGDFTFFMVGNFDIEKVKPLLAKYIGSLPAKNKSETFVDRYVRPPSGVVNKIVKKGSDPKSMVNLSFTGEFDYSRESAHQLKSLAELLTIKLVESLREEQSGVYGVGARASASPYPYDNYSFTISFPCGPENVESLIASVFKEIEKIKTSGPMESDVKKVQETQRRNHEEQIEKNNYWLSSMQQKHYYKEPLNEDDPQLNFTASLSAASLQEAANKFLNEENYIRVVLMPEENTIRAK